MRNNENKKYPFNPSEKVGFLLAVIVLSVLWLGVLIFGYIKSPEAFDISNFWQALGVIIMIIAPILIISIVYIIKLSGYFYIENNELILVKGKRSLIVKIEDIDVIKLEHFVRPNRGVGKSRKENAIQFLIKMKNEKTTLPFLITNSMLYKVLEPYNVRFRPKEFIEYIEKDLSNRK